jgi:protein arginine kinase activator
VRDLHFCSECTERYKNGENPPIPVQVNSGALNLLTQFIGLLTKKKAKQNPIELPERQCPSCRSTLKDISTTGQLGCAECYAYFGEDMKRVLEKIHRNIEHVGKRPKPPEPSKEERLADLQAKMSLRHPVGKLRGRRSSEGSN